MNSTGGSEAITTEPRPARFAGNAQRSAARVALRALIVEAFASMTATEVVARLDAAQIANARVNEMADVWRHAQLRARARWVAVDTPAGPVHALLPPGVHRREDARMDAVPALGQHTDAILTELGYAQADVAALRAAGAI